LLERVGDALADHEFELLFVDDSSDQTPQIVKALAPQFPFPIRLIVRPPSLRNGLSGAVVDGIAAARGIWVCVMDGDLQHPPELLPQMIQAAKKTQADMIVGSRRANVLGPMGLSLFRTMISQILTITARALFPRSLKDVSDPLTGLFMVKREKIKLDRLRPNGFKILLEILIRCPHMRIAEVKFDFAERVAEESKADFREGMRFFNHLMHLRTTAHQRPLLRYLLVTATALLINIYTVIFIIQRWGDTRFVSTMSVIGATVLADAWSYWGNRWIVIPDDELGDTDFRRVFWINLGMLLMIHLPLFWVFHWVLAQSVLFSNILAIVIAGFCRYMLSDQWIWTRGLLTVRRPTFYYDIHQLVLLESAVQLPDLATFQVDEPDRAPEIRIRVDRHGTPRRTHNGISYDDRLGRFGFGLTVLPAEHYVEAVVSPIVARSNHVLYINVVEPLLRWMLVYHDVALVRAGCLRIDGHCYLISDSSRDAMTQRILSEIAANNGEVEYISHDLTFVRADGTAFAYPNTIIQQKVLEWPLIRRFGAFVRELRLPAATIGTWIQILWPPMQLTIQQKIGVARLCNATQIDSIEIYDVNGQRIGGDMRVDQWQANTTDEFGFPLYSDLISHFHISGSNVHLKEREILNCVLQKAPVPM
ncbi:MAG: glycosyltransferase, partial [Chloroflexota bacterium]